MLCSSCISGNYSICMQLDHNDLSYFMRDLKIKPAVNLKKQLEFYYSLILQSIIDYHSQPLIIHIQSLNILILSLFIYTQPLIIYIQSFLILILSFLILILSLFINIQQFIIHTLSLIILTQSLIIHIQ